MNTLLATLSLIFVACATPGPNNLFMTRLAAARGMWAVVPGIAGIVLGGIAMLALAHVGLSEVLVAAPGIRQAIVLAGSAVLVWAGLRLVMSAHRPPETAARALPHGTAALFAFQFVNPKSWTLTLTVAAAMPATAALRDDALVIAAVYASFLLVPLACTLAWAGFGHLAAAWLQAGRRRVHFDRTMGMLLAASAGMLLVQP